MQVAETETLTFSQQLRDATEVVHAAAEHSPFVTALVEGTLPRDEFTRLVRQLHAVYTELEAATAASTDADLAPLMVPELARTGALAADLDHLAGAGWRDEIATVPATDAYCARIREVATASRGGLLAHHYVRYMGDLSGGQILGRVVARVYELPDGLGTSAYRFEEIESPKRFKGEYRATVDRLPWDADERARVAAEAVVAFDCNTAIFRDLEATRTA